MDRAVEFLKTMGSVGDAGYALCKVDAAAWLAEYAKEHESVSPLTIRELILANEHVGAAKQRVGTTKSAKEDK